MNEIDPDSTVIIDSSVLIAVGGPENEKFQALAEHATQRDHVFQLPRRVLEELDESPPQYATQRTRVRAAIDQGWLTPAPTLDYTNSDVAAVMDAVRARMAKRANSHDDAVKKTDTALAGLAVQLLTTDQEVDNRDDPDGRCGRRNRDARRVSGTIDCRFDYDHRRQTARWGTG